MNNQLPKIQPKGELQIGDTDIKRHAPDLIEKRHEIASDLATVHKLKPQMDAIMQHIADTTGAQMTTRVKNPEMIVRKVVQKRMEDRNYKLSDLNDLYGARFIVQDDTQEDRVKKAIKQLADRGAFVIISEEARNKDTYHAYHYDIAFPIAADKSVRCEVQIMDQSAEAQAAVTHDAHAKFSDTPPENVEQDLTKQTREINELPPIKQKAVADTMMQAHKANNDKPLPNDFSKKVIDQVKKT